MTLHWDHIDDEAVKTAKLLAADAVEQAGPKLIVSGGCGWGLGSLPRFSLWEEVMEEVGAELNAKK